MMSSDKIGLTLFDTLGYLLPGYVVLFTLSLVEATFFTHSLFALSVLSDNWLLSSVIAYFLGHLSHRIASSLESKRPAWFDNRKLRLSDSVYYHIRQLFNDMHIIKFKEGERLHSIETYMLADSYVVASGHAAERDSLMAREGFNKTSMVAFALLAISVFATLFAGGTKLQLTAGNYVSLSFVASILAVVLLVAITAAFWRGYAFFNRLKINNVLFLAMTLRTLDKERLEKEE